MAYPGNVPGKRLENTQVDTIKMDIVEVTGRTLESCKFLGLVPSDILGDDDYNVYVRWDDNGTIRADRSDTDRMIAAASIKGNGGKAAALVQLMENISRFYGRKVTVAVDPGTKAPAAMAKVIGEHDGRPVVEPVTVVEVADVVATVTRNGRVFTAEAYNFGRPAAFERAVALGLLARVDDGDMSRWVLPEPTVYQVDDAVVLVEKAGTVRVDRVPATGLPVGAFDRAVSEGRLVLVSEAGNTAWAVPGSMWTAEVGDTIYRRSDGHQGTIVAELEFGLGTTTFRVDFAHAGEYLIRTAAELVGMGYEIIPAAEVEAGQQHTDRVSRDHALGVKVNRPFGMLLNRRKRKATRRNRARVGGGF